MIAHMCKKFKVTRILGNRSITNGSSPKKANADKHIHEMSKADGGIF